MKKERFFRLLGDLDDHILDKYREMDAQLSHKALRKKRALRVLLIAACLALLIGACVPVGMLAHPAGRAILRGDSEALTEQLNRIDGFKSWQEITAEKLEQSLSPKAWESLQKMPVINVLTQSQYPDYAFKSMQYGAYLDEPEYLTYGFADSVGDYFPDRVDIDVYGEEYQDVNAPSNCPPPPGSSLEEGQVLPYRYSIPQTLYMQAVHVYELRVDKVSHTVYMDAQTGECVYWEISKASSHSPTVADEQTMIDAAYDILSQTVRDPEAYTLSTDRNDYYFICRYNRNIGDFESCDGVTVRFDLAGNILSVDLSYLGALRYLSEVPRELVDQINAYMEQTVVGCISSEIGIGNITVLSDGRIALTCYMKVEYNDAQSDTRQGDATWFLACLTEPVEGYGDLGVTSHTESETTEPVTTEPVVTEPPPTETPHMIRLGSLAELDLMRDMILCEDEQELSQYLSSLNAMGQNAQSKQDLIDFVDLVDSTPFAKILDGEIICLEIIMSPNSKYHTKNLFVDVKGENGDSISYTYLWSDISVSERIQSVLKTAGTNNLLQAPVQSADGRLTIYTEMREKLILGSKYRIQWWGELDGVFMEITYNVVKPEDVITSEVIGSLEMTSIVAQP